MSISNARGNKLVKRKRFTNKQVQNTIYINIYIYIYSFRFAKPTIQHHVFIFGKNMEEKDKKTSG